jgi:hypothetical protein
MNSQAIRDLVKAVFSDEKTRQEFVSDPNRVIARYALTDPEKEAVLGTYISTGLVTGNSAALAADIQPLGFWF